MIKVEQRKTPKKGYVRYQIQIDDEIFYEKENRRSDRRLWFSCTYPNEIILTVVDSILIKKIGEHTFTQLPKEIKTLAFDVENGMDLKCDLIVPNNHLSVTQYEGGYELYWVLETVRENSESPLSRAEFVVEVYKRLVTQYQVEIEDSTLSALSISCQVQSPESTIAAEISTHREQVQKILDQAAISVTPTVERGSFKRDSLAVSFDFPEPIKTACEQYLLYFGQFLKDLGVSATTALTHETGQVLFTVTPTSREEALEKIRQALDLYLELPSSPISDSVNESIAVQRLESNVLRLRSDLRLAAAELQAKEATINAQNLMIGILNGEVLIDSVKEVSPKSEAKEDVIPGIVSLSTYKDKGVELNLGEMFRRLKKFFRDD